MRNHTLQIMLSLAIFSGGLVGCTSARPAREGVDPDWTYRDAGDSLTFSSVWDDDFRKPAEGQVAIAKGIEFD